MLYSSEYVIMMAREQQLQECLRRAEVERLLRDARPHRQGWLNHQARRLLQSVGHVLFRVGEQLDGLETGDAPLTQQETIGRPVL